MPAGKLITRARMEEHIKALESWHGQVMTSLENFEHEILVAAVQALKLATAIRNAKKTLSESFEQKEGNYYGTDQRAGADTTDHTSDGR